MLLVGSLDPALLYQLEMMFTLFIRWNFPLSLDCRHPLNTSCIYIVDSRDLIVLLYPKPFYYTHPFTAIPVPPNISKLQGSLIQVRMNVKCKYHPPKELTRIFISHGYLMLGNPLRSEEEVKDYRSLFYLMIAALHNPAYIWYGFWPV